MISMFWIKIYEFLMHLKKHPLNHLNVIWIISQHLANEVVTAVGTSLCCGHIITRIAKSMGLFNNEEMEIFCEPVKCKPVDVRSFWYLRDETGKLKNLPEVLEVEPLNEW